MNDAAAGADESLDVVIQNNTLAVDVDLCRRVLRRVFDDENVPVEQVTLIQADHDTVRHLNRTFLEHDYDTDVLAFCYSDEDQDLEGEIYVDLDTASERHDEFGASFEQEVLRYAVHGALHLAGYRDETEAGKREMREREDAYLRAAGVF